MSSHARAPETRKQKSIGGAGAHKEVMPDKETMYQYEIRNGKTCELDLEAEGRKVSLQIDEAEHVNGGQ
jgi:hypothetical protein